MGLRDRPEFCSDALRARGSLYRIAWRMDHGRHAEALGVVLTVGDDGRGIDGDRVAERGRALRLPVAHARELEDVLCADGVSTRGDVTLHSGRGVGLGAVREEVRRLGGRVELSSAPGRGTIFRICLPEAMLVEEAAHDGKPGPVERRNGDPHGKPAASSL
jgi:two-component sensor histidine kinase